MTALQKFIDQHRHRGIDEALVADWLGTRKQYVVTLCKTGLRNADHAMIIYCHMRLMFPDEEFDIENTIWTSDRIEAFIEQLRKENMEYAK
jgi:hypothetical protein